MIPLLLVWVCAATSGLRASYRALLAIAERVPAPRTVRARRDDPRRRARRRRRTAGRQWPAGLSKRAHAVMCARSKSWIGHTPPHVGGAKTWIGHTTPHVARLRLGTRHTRPHVSRPRLGRG